MNRSSPSMKKRTSQRGLTLVEVMVAITISLILLAGVMQIFISSRQTYRAQDGQARIQENGRFAMQFLRNDIRMAGYTGCTSRSAVTNSITAGANAIAANFADRGISGFEYASLPQNITSASALASSDVVAGTDVIIIKNASPVGAVVAAPTALTAAGDVTVSSGTAAGAFAAGDILFISDCSQIDIFTAAAITPGAITTSIAHAAPFTKIYAAGTDAEVMEMEIYAYYIAADAANNNAPTLYRRRLTAGSAMVAEPLVEGVENMQILYGEDTDGPPAGLPDQTANRYVSAGTPGLNMSNVVSVRLSLLLRSAENNVAAQPQPYTFNGIPVTPTDRRLRRVFTTTIRLRNR